MRDFSFYAPTEVVFGRQAEEQVAPLVKKYGGTKVLVHYGGQSAVRSGLLDKVCGLLDAAGVPYVKGIEASRCFTLKTWRRFTVWQEADYR